MADQKGIVTVYSKETCPHCKEAKKLLTEKYGLDIVEVDVLGPETEKILQQMRQFSGGRNTVPQVFFNAEHLGGNDDVQSLDKDGTLEAKVETVKNTEAMMMPHWFHPWY
jgi:glutaredoxin 3